MTAAGLMVVSDLVHRAIHTLQHTSQVPQGHWVMMGIFLAPQGLAVDALGCFLVTDYVPGAVHSFTLGPTLELLIPAPVLGLEGPCWVGLGFDRGFVMSEKCPPAPGLPGGLWQSAGCVH